MIVLEWALLADTEVAMRVSFLYNKGYCPLLETKKRVQC